MRQHNTDPVLPFLGLFENTTENLKNTKDFSRLANSLKTQENKQKTPQKTKEFRSEKKTKETKTPRKGRTIPSTIPLQVYTFIIPKKNGHIKLPACMVNCFPRECTL